MSAEEWLDGDRPATAVERAAFIAGGEADAWLLKMALGATAFAVTAVACIPLLVIEAAIEKVTEARYRRWSGR